MGWVQGRSRKHWSRPAARCSLSQTSKRRSPCAAHVPTVAIVALDGYRPQRAVRLSASCDRRGRERPPRHRGAAAGRQPDFRTSSTSTPGSTGAVCRRARSPGSISKALFERLPPRGIMSHLACAADADHPMNDLQQRRFQQLYALLRPRLGKPCRIVRRLARAALSFRRDPAGLGALWAERSAHASLTASAGADLVGRGGRGARAEPRRDRGLRRDVSGGRARPVLPSSAWVMPRGCREPTVDLWLASGRSRLRPSDGSRWNG